MSAALTREEEQFYCACPSGVSRESAVVNCKWDIQELFLFLNVRHPKSVSIYKSKLLIWGTA